MRASQRHARGPAFLPIPLLLAGAVAAAFAVASTPRPALGSIVIALDLPELVRQAEHIAVVEVGQVQAAWDARHERIYSTIDLKVIESWKSGNAAAASPATHLTVVQPGGTVGDITMTVTGLGTFVPGERSLVFLRGPTGRAQLVGMTQGKRPVRYEAASRRWLVAPPDLRQAKLIRPSALPSALPSSSGQAAPALQSRTPAPVPPLTSTPPATLGSRDRPLDDLRTEVKKLLGAAGTR